MNRNPNGPKSNFGPRWKIKVDLYNPCSGADRVPLSIDVPVRVKEIDIAYAIVGFHCGQKSKVVPSRNLRQYVPYSNLDSPGLRNLDWPAAVAGEADSVSSVSASACHIGGPIYVNPGELALVYGICKPNCKVVIPWQNLCQAKPGQQTCIALQSKHLVKGKLWNRQ